MNNKQEFQNMALSLIPVYGEDAVRFAICEEAVRCNKVDVSRALYDMAHSNDPSTYFTDNGELTEEAKFIINTQQGFNEAIVQFSIDEVIDYLENYFHEDIDWVGATSSVLARLETNSI
jgi:hypothetical protein